MANAKAITKAEKKAATSLARAEKMREDAKEAAESVTRTALTMGGALGMAYWQGRYPDRREILGIDAALVVGGGLTVAALMGWAGKQEMWVEALGTGALSTYAVTTGLRLGQEGLATAA